MRERLVRSRAGTAPSRRSAGGPASLAPEDSRCKQAAGEPPPADTEPEPQAQARTKERTKAPAGYPTMRPLAPCPR